MPQNEQKGQGDAELLRQGCSLVTERLSAFPAPLSPNGSPVPLSACSGQNIIETGWVATPPAGLRIARGRKRLEKTPVSAFCLLARLPPTQPAWARQAAGRAAQL